MLVAPQFVGACGFPRVRYRSSLKCRERSEPVRVDWWCGAWWVLARMAVPAKRMTADPPTIVIRVMVSPRMSPAQMMLWMSWMSWAWLTCAIAPVAPEAVPGEEA